MTKLISSDLVSVTDHITNFSIEESILGDYFHNKGRYTVQTKKLAIVFNLLKRDLDNAECANVITVFEDSSFRLLKVKGFENCKFRSE